VGSAAGQETDTWPARVMNFLIWKRRNPQKIPPPAGESRALPKYFEHAGALLTADGTNLLMARIIDGINENRWLNDSLK
jgi:hypothetical protein